MLINIEGFDVLIDDEDFERVNAVDWHISDNRYFRKSRRLKGRYVSLWLHRFIVGASSDMEVDHINCDTFDNRKQNLRICNKYQNAQNRRRFANNKSGYKGVSPDRGRWRAYISVEGKCLHLGCYDTKEEAYSAYCEASKQYHKEFGRIA